MRQFTKEEIKMAKKAEEIQALRPDGYEDGNILWDTRDKELHIVSLHSHYLTPQHVWLPLEHQLWEMGGKAIDPKYGMGSLSNFNDWVITGGFMEHAKGFHIWSLWELLLAFVMYKRYDKVWNGEGWVKK